MGRGHRPVLAGAGAEAGEHQTTIFERLDILTRLAEARDPRAPATTLFCIVLTLVTFGLLIQASHAATTLEAQEFRDLLLSQTSYRFLGLAVLLAAARLGPSGIRPAIPALTAAAIVLLVCVFVPGLEHVRNGSHRWVNLGIVRFQPSELARLVLCLWVADRCVRLGPLVCHARRGVVPMLLLGLLFFGLVAIETDLGGALLLFLCCLSTMWVGGARPTHVWGSFMTVGAAALALGFAVIPYVRARLRMFLGETDNDQLIGSLQAMQSGGWFGAGLGQGQFRNHGVPYLESDFVFAQVGEEFGLVGMLLLLGLFTAFLWFSLRLVLSLQDRFDALASFALLLSTTLQAMLHIQVVCGLAPPKGMTLPFISHGGTSLIVSCLGVGLALGAARQHGPPNP